MKPYSFRFSLLLTLLSFFLLQGCEDKEEEKLNPEIQTLEITLLSPSTAILKGNIVTTGKLPVLEYGFVYGFSPDINEKSGTKVSFGKDAQAGAYSKELWGLGMSNSYDYDRTLYARAYIKNQHGTMFGQLASVSLPSYIVKSITPNIGKAGDRITLTGSFYTDNMKEVEASFAGARAKVLEVSSSKIVLEVPAGITNSYQGTTQIPIILSLAGQTFYAGSSFQIIPVIGDFAPKSGSIGTTFFISGENLPSPSSFSSTGNPKVFMNEVEVDVPMSGYSTTGFHVIVPDNVSAEKVTIAVLIQGVRTPLPGEFTITPHTVSSISPASGFEGNSFSIFGSSFIHQHSYYNNYITVKVGDIPTTLSHVSADKLTAFVPENLPAGDYKITVKAGPHTVEAPQPYTVLAPSITTFTPASGGAGRQVTINGVFPNNRYCTVYFGSVARTTHSTSNAITVEVPAGLDPGKVKLSVRQGNYLMEAEDEFTVVVPTITSFSPSAAVAGSVVTITGTGFNPDLYTTVNFGTIETPALSVTETTVRVIVPSGLTGSMKLSVVQYGQVAISNDNFTATN